MKRIYSLSIFYLLAFEVATCQTNESTSVENIIRLNVLNPGAEIELIVGDKSTFAINPGVTFSGSYLHLTARCDGFRYFISPFLDTSLRRYYNWEKRSSKGKNLAGNSANYYSMRLFTKFKEI